MYAEIIGHKKLRRALLSLQHIDCWVCYFQY